MEDIVAIVGFFSTVIIVTLGFPLVRAYVRNKEKAPPRELLNVDAKLGEMNSALDAMSIEIERISENQRFLTKLLAERESAKAALPGDRS
jgi:hypothetical protein